MARRARAVTSVEALIFDMDGTMVDSMPVHAKSWDVFCRRHGVDLPVDEVLRRTTGRTGVECMRVLLGDELTDAQAAALVDEKESLYRELFAPVFREVPGFRRLVDAALQRGLKLAIATAGDKHNIAFTLGHLKLREPPKVIVGGDEGLRGKPQPDLFLEAARRLGVPPDRCVVFEDAPFGIEAARRAGMRAVSVCTTHPPEELGGDHVIAQCRDYEELLTNHFLESLDA